MEQQEPITNERWKHFDTSNTGGPSKTDRQRYWWISDHGRVKCTHSYNDFVKWPTISLTGGREGSRYSAISPNYLLNKYVHKLVAIKFCHNPFGIYEGREITVDHIDGNKTNNHYTNLEWVTAKENQHRYWERYRAGTYTPSEQQIITSDSNRHQVDEQILDLYRSGLSVSMIMKRLSITFSRATRPVSAYRKANGIRTLNRPSQLKYNKRK